MNLKNSVLENFNKCNFNAILFEIEAKYEIGISTWLGYNQHTKEEFEWMYQTLLNVFEDVFDSHSENVSVIVNHWDMQKDLYMLNQFEAYKDENFYSRIFVDETQDIEKIQINIDTIINAINYKNILRKFLERDYDNLNEVNSRIFFIHPEKMMYLLYFDSMIVVGSDHLHPIAPFFYKYKDLIHPNIKKQFFKLLKK